MAKIAMPYGKKSLELNLPDDQILEVVLAKPPKIPKVSQEEALRDALAHPVESPPLDELLKPGEKVCLIVPDITRLWESTFISTPILLDALNHAGISDSDITILCACGTHRAMTEKEHAALLGAQTLKRVKVVDHQCGDNDNLKFMGETSRGTPVFFNRHAVEADKVVTSCGIVYHFFAGFGGGAKMLLPGISGCETIMRNHSLALNPGPGSGENPGARAGNIGPSNPVHADMVEAASMLPPCFSLNVVVNDKFEIIKAFAGQWRQSHIEGCKLVADMDGVKIPAKSGLVIASAGGYPKDINLYQGIKLAINAEGAARPGATIILIGEFSEAFGNADFAKQVQGFGDMKSREAALRANFTIGAYGGFLFAEACGKYRIILVSEMPASDFGNLDIRIVKTIGEALELAGGAQGERAIVMPHGATTLPIPPG